MSTTYIFIKYAKGVDGGFGDYCSPDWSHAPSLKDENGNLIWFNDMEEAQAFASRCSELSAKEFYSVGFHDEYDGNFPVEYQAISLEIPGNPPVSHPDNVFASIKESLKKTAVEDCVFYDFDYYFEEEE